ncbi:F-box/kelch-repeat protein At3g23880 [Beta vulgaris subsp. vulgaris]|uniref:F-box/kelch-repeat protein At3g23880 n=1 Tax=Beta vulgaris subsp. vulgaris TaxID=3555 RepID=UPI00053FC762|nr:F-box/kelch-repeat protein At3g23880 [Beta vulgaris subsp. vulgaris]
MEDEKVDDVVLQRHLPHELITQHILTRLPVKSLLQFKSVSKQWYFSLSSYQFAHTHFQLSSFSLSSTPTQFMFIQNLSNFYLFSCDDHDGDEIGSITVDRNKNLVKLGFDFDGDNLVLIGCCNGLVCLASFSDYFFILWNPVTTQFRKYSDPDVFVDSTSNFRVSWGFGYVSGIDDYKVVRILELNTTLEIRVHVFSLKSNKWSRIANELYQGVISLTTDENEEEIESVLYYHREARFRFPYSIHLRQGVLINESLYWIASDTNASSDCARKIVVFDLVRETFDTIGDLDLVSSDVYWDRIIFSMGGCLSKCGINKRDDVYIDILKGPGEVDRIHLSRDLRLRSCQGVFGFTRTSKFYILLEDSTIGIVNPRAQPMKYTPVITFERLGKSRAANYVPSLILPYTVA